MCAWGDTCISIILNRGCVLEVISLVTEICVSPKMLRYHDSNQGVHVLRLCTAVNKEESLFKVFTGVKIENPTSMCTKWKDMCK